MNDISNLLQNIENLAAKADPIGDTVKFDFGDSQIFLDGTGSTNQISQENKDASCSFVMSSEDLSAMLAGELNPMMAVMEGKVKIEGDMGVAMKLQGLFS
ncbi:MAG: SCP2 sterol-binding domain-containing protein [Flavobacteriales bacterium]|nr:SCP2 sterol-binding domain-containing protein [Flavobacteriales bacterium]